MMKKMMTVLIVLAFTCSSLLLMTSCAKKYLGRGEIVEGPGIQSPAAKPSGPPGGKPSMGPSGRDMSATAEAKWQKLQREMAAFESGNIYFDYDRSELKPAARATLEKKAGWLRANPKLSVRIEGHCDDRGTNEYNLALGERRANAAWKFLNAMGISGSRMTTVSYGEEKPAASGRNKAAWAKNRRDEFKLVNKPRKR